ncbi:MULTISPECIES: hypothetical protein [unclassified Streptomyces]|uniref:hypothetical protein n=1 Tax=Streptomyces sp. NPDC055082 TaxID=3365718 RepID=UPI0037D3A695
MHFPFITARRNRRISEVLRDEAVASLLVSNEQLHASLNDLNSRVGAMVKIGQHNENLVMAAMDVVHALDDSWVAQGVASHLSEPELAPLLRLFRVAGRVEAVEVWERANAVEDKDSNQLASA